MYNIHSWEVELFIELGLGMSRFVYKRFVYVTMNTVHIVMDLLCI